MYETLIQQLAQQLDGKHIPYIEKWLAEFSHIPEYENVLTQWKKMLRES